MIYCTTRWASRRYSHLLHYPPLFYVVLHLVKDYTRGIVGICSQPVEPRYTVLKIAPQQNQRVNIRLTCVQLRCLGPRSWPEHSLGTALPVAESATGSFREISQGLAGHSPSPMQLDRRLGRIFLLSPLYCGSPGRAGRAWACGGCPSHTGRCL